MVAVLYATDMLAIYFYPQDIEVIKEIVTLKNSGSLTLSEAVKAILESDIDDITNTAPLTNNNTLSIT